MQAASPEEAAFPGWEAPFPPAPSRRPTRIGKSPRSRPGSQRIHGVPARGARNLLSAGVMLHAFAGLAFLFALLDHLTTWLCLRAAIPGWEIHEANPLAAWLFERVGLAPGLAIDTAVTALALVLVAYAARMPRAARLSLLGMLIGTSAYAVANNFDVIQQIGLQALTHA